jgi:hypothetical protein
MTTDKDSVISRAEVDTVGIDKKRSNHVLREFNNNSYNPDPDYEFDDEFDYDSIDWGYYVNTQILIISHNTLGNLEIRDNSLKIINGSNTVFINATAIVVNNSSNSLTINAHSIYINGSGGNFLLRAPNAGEVAAGATLTAAGWSFSPQIVILTQPANATANTTSSENVTFLVVAEALPVAEALTYSWTYANGATIIAGANVGNTTQANLVVNSAVQTTNASFKVTISGVTLPNVVSSNATLTITT